MRIVPTMITPGNTPVPTAPTNPSSTPSDWTNPAAAAALRSTVDLLKGIEDGMVRNFTNVSLIRAYAADLKSTVDIFDAATEAITGDASKENDTFLPLILNAGGGVVHAESRLSSKDLQQTWPVERGDILAAIRRAKAISQNVADQLDPRSMQPR